MKKSIFVLTLLFLAAVFSWNNVYAHYDKGDVKTEVKKIESGVQVTMTSDDPSLVTAIQDDSKYYRDKWNHDGYCPHMRPVNNTHCCAMGY